MSTDAAGRAWRWRRKSGKSRIVPCATRVSTCLIVDTASSLAPAPAMWRILLSQLKRGHRMLAYPDVLSVMPESFRGLPVVDPERCPALPGGQR